MPSVPIYWPIPDCQKSPETYVRNRYIYYKRNEWPDGILATMHAANFRFRGIGLRSSRACACKTFFQASIYAASANGGSVPHLTSSCVMQPKSANTEPATRDQRSEGVRRALGVCSVANPKLQDLSEVNRCGSLKIKLHEKQIRLQFRVTFAFRIPVDLAKPQAAIQTLCSSVVDARIQKNVRCTQVSRLGQNILH